ncbi:MAG: hypothetical protein KatS3mg111_2591 [Pirellulaceae bacterium]|nr:MAG: hypothetical protein KatS3mg111_2591 [Pirellulaceae bacterium]
MGVKEAKVGDKMVFAKDKHSPSPGPRAREVVASPKGDDYSYIVEKYWTVVDVRPDGKLLLRTRRGKEHLVSRDDPRLRHATLWERWRYRHRFPKVASTHETIERTT